MNSIKKQARFAGLVYLLACLPAPFCLVYPGALIVSGDATAAADHVRASETLLRLGIAGELINATAFIFVVFALYRLFKGVNQQHAADMVTLFVVSVLILRQMNLAIVDAWQRPLRVCGLSNLVTHLRSN